MNRTFIATIMCLLTVVGRSADDDAGVPLPATSNAVERGSRRRKMQKTIYKDTAYYGRTVTPRDADKVLMRWKVSDNECRVIFGDLHTQTVTAEKLAELEKNLPK